MYKISNSLVIESWGWDLNQFTYAWASGTANPTLDIASCIPTCLQPVELVIYAVLFLASWLNKNAGSTAEKKNNSLGWNLLKRIIKKYKRRSSAAGLWLSALCEFWLRAYTLQQVFIIRASWLGKRSTDSVFFSPRINKLSQSHPPS